jgi:hypothetical protein
LSFVSRTFVGVACAAGTATTKTTSANNQALNAPRLIIETPFPPSVAAERGT